MTYHFAYYLASLVMSVALLATYAVTDKLPLAVCALFLLGTAVLCKMCDMETRLP